MESAHETLNRLNYRKFHLFGNDFVKPEWCHDGFLAGAWITALADFLCGDSWKGSRFYQTRFGAMNLIVMDMES
jgi:hypothetical protein